MSEKIESFSIEDRIERWKIIHSKLFPKATAYSQIIQLDEELGELEVTETSKDFGEELGDVLVVAISLLRFKTTHHIAKFIIDKEIYKKASKEQTYRLRLIDKAISKCKKRVSEDRYNFKNGLYTRDKSVK